MRVETREERGEAGGLRGGIVLAGDERPLEEDAAAGLRAVGAAGGDQVGQRPAAAGRDERGTLLLGGTVQAHGEMIRTLFFREAQDAGLLWAPLRKPQTWISS